MTGMPSLETDRLLVRPLSMQDLPAVVQLLDVELRDAALGAANGHALEERRAWLQWTVLGYDQFANLHQPPYGERAIALKQTGQLIGLCGYVPCLNPFEQVPGLAPKTSAPGPSRYTTEFGLFYATDPAFRRQGYTSEAVRAMIDYAFREMHLKRIIATTDYDNVGSMGVMRRLGMRIEKNPYPEPPWLQVVGVLDNPDAPFTLE